MDYTLTSRQLRSLKTQLTKAIKSGDAWKIISTCNEAMAIFAQKGFPDCWSNWQRAKDDALFSQTHQSYQGII
jgi:hypothetical protein